MKFEIKKKYSLILQTFFFKCQILLLFFEM